MKNILSILALATSLLIVNSAQSQNQLLLGQDSLNQKIEDINLRLNNFSKRASIGNEVLAVGVILSLVGTSINLFADKAYANAGYGITILGGGLSTTGLIINLTANRKVRNRNYEN